MIMRDMKPSHRQNENGFTLIEALLAVVILAMVISAILMPFTAAAQNEQVDARWTVAVSLGEEMMEEVLSRPFNDPDGASVVGPDAGEGSRDEFDNIDDYDGYVESIGNIASFDGEAASDPAVTRLSREVTASYVYVSGQDTSNAPTFIRVVVEVKHNGVAIVTFTRLVYALGA